MLIALNSATPRIDEARYEEITRDLGEILLLGIYFHDLFMSKLANHGVAPRSEGAPLTLAEKYVLDPLGSRSDIW